MPTQEISIANGRSQRHRFPSHFFNWKLDLVVNERRIILYRFVIETGAEKFLPESEFTSELKWFLFDLRFNAQTSFIAISLDADWRSNIYWPPKKLEKWKENVTIIKDWFLRRSKFTLANCDRNMEKEIETADKHII